MAETHEETKDSTKVKDTDAEASEAEENLLSLEDLDSTIAKNDPEFAAHLKDIGPNEEMQNALFNDELEYSFAEEQALWQHGDGWRPRLAKILPFVVRLSFRWRLLGIRRKKSWAQAKISLKSALPLFWKWLKKRAQILKTSLGASLSVFKELSFKKKLGFLGLLALLGLVGFVIYRSSTKGLFPPAEELFVSSLQEWSQEDYNYDPKTEVESFYESTHSARNIIVLTKMVVNLKRSPSAGVNPMGAFEFYVEGAASDVVVEIKDREIEVRDLFQRTLEDMSFDQISSAEGKQLLCEKLRKEVNKILTKGKVRRVYIKTAILKA